jgi:DNA-directed RNA polymerase specialized sigma24 family protein
LKKVPNSDRDVAEGRFAEVFAHLDLNVQYAWRRGARDPDGIAAEAMAIAWRRLADVPKDDPRPWLIVTAGNLLLAERRSEPRLDARRWRASISRRRPTDCGRSWISIPSLRER